MTADYLLIDVGNGRTKLGLSTRDAILDRRECPTRGVTAALVREAIAGWDFRAAVLCSVVPDAVAAFREALGVDLIELRHDTPMGIGIRYPSPASIGPDRLANADRQVFTLGGNGATPGKPDGDRSRHTGKQQGPTRNLEVVRIIHGSFLLVWGVQSMPAWRAFRAAFSGPARARLAPAAPSQD